MAIATDNSAAVFETATLSFTVGNGTNRLLVVAIIGDTSDNITAATYGIQSMTLIAKNQVPSVRYCYLYYLINPTSGTANIAVIGYAFPCFEVASYTGVKQDVPDSSNSVTGTGVTTKTASTTVVSSNCWLMSLVGTNNVSSGTISAGAGSFLRAVDSDGRQGLLDSNGTVGTGSQSLITNIAASANVSMIIASFAPAITNQGNMFQLF